jgi:hypothetical protein
VMAATAADRVGEVSRLAREQAGGGRRTAAVASGAADSSEVSIDEGAAAAYGEGATSVAALDDGEEQLDLMR